MRLAAIALFFCPLAFSQTEPSVRLLDRLNPQQQDRLQERFKSMKLFNEPRLLTEPKLLGPKVMIAGHPAVCAIPLLQALPKRDKTEYKIHVYAPPSHGDAMVSVPAIDSCK